MYFSFTRPHNDSCIIGLVSTTLNGGFDLLCNHTQPQPLLFQLLLPLTARGWLALLLCMGAGLFTNLQPHVTQTLCRLNLHNRFFTYLFLLMDDREPRSENNRQTLIISYVSVLHTLIDSALFSIISTSLIHTGNPRGRELFVLQTDFEVLRGNTRGAKPP